MNQVSDRLRNLVPKKGRSISAVAKQLGISSQLLGQYINQRQKPKPDFYKKWKEVFGEDLMEAAETNVSEKATVNEPELPYSIPAHVYIEKLEQDKEFLKHLVQSSLMGLAISLDALTNKLSVEPRISDSVTELGDDDHVEGESTKGKVRTSGKRGMNP